MWTRNDQRELCVLSSIWAWNYLTEPINLGILEKASSFRIKLGCCSQQTQKCLDGETVINSNNTVRTFTSKLEAKKLTK